MSSTPAIRRLPDGTFEAVPLHSKSSEPEEDLLDEAKRLTSTDRGRDYGYPLDNFTQIAAAWTNHVQKKLKEPLDVRDVVWFMVLLKACRDSHSPKRDNLVDTAGYARCAQMAEDEAKGRDTKEAR